MSQGNLYNQFHSVQRAVWVLLTYTFDDGEKAMEFVMPYEDRNVSYWVGRW